MLGENYLSQYKFKYDLHVHTSPVSPCADFSPEETVARYAALGFDGIVITNHFKSGVFKDMTKSEAVEYYLNDYKKAKAEGEKHGIDIILGFETKYPENANDYLVYGVCEDDVALAYDYIHKDYKTFYKEFRNDKNLIVQAHPFRNDMVLQDADFLDGIEVYNLHPHHNSRVALAAKWAKENPHFIVTGGTDFHHENHEGMCAVRTREKITDSHKLAKILKSRDYIFDIWGQAVLPY